MVQGLSSPPNASGFLCRVELLACFWRGCLTDRFNEPPSSWCIPENLNDGSKKLGYRSPSMCDVTSRSHSEADCRGPYGIEIRGATEGKISVRGPVPRNNKRSKLWDPMRARSYPQLIKKLSPMASPNTAAGRKAGGQAARSRAVGGGPHGRAADTVAAGSCGLLFLFGRDCGQQRATESAVAERQCQVVVGAHTPHSRPDSTNHHHHHCYRGNHFGAQEVGGGGCQIHRFGNGQRQDVSPGLPVGIVALVGRG